jgi:hypothetical protein
MEENAPRGEIRQEKGIYGVIEYEVQAGCGHFIATYAKDWKPKECKNCRSQRQREEAKRRKSSSD